MTFEELIAEVSVASHYPEVHRAAQLAELQRLAAPHGHHFFRRPALRPSHSEIEAPAPFDVRLV